MTSLAAPDCALDAGSWCARLWEFTGIGWLSENIDQVAAAVLRIVLIIAIALIVRSLVHRAIKRLTRPGALSPAVLQPLRDKAESALLGSQSVTRRRQRAEALGSLLRSITSFVVLIVAVILILAEVGVNITPLLASAGIAGVALGFGAQSLVKDFLSGVFMTLEDQFGIGDLVDLGEATGTVIAVGLRITTIRSADGTVWHVRNGEILRVGNSSQGAAVVNIDLPIGYQVDADRAGEVALQALLEVAASEEFVDGVIKQPTLQGVIGMAADTVTVRVDATVSPTIKWAFSVAARSAIKAAFDQSGIEAPLTRLWPGRPTPPA